MSSEIISTNTKDVKLTNFQKWVLLYFLKYKDKEAPSEDLIENMCLTAVVDLDIDSVGNELTILKNLGH